jgi:hypothetical protein
MNYHPYPFSFRKYSLILIYAFFFMAVFAWCMEIYFEKLYGDLTRVGYFSERDFGWRSPQPAIPPELFKDYPLTEADILVIGDSFSDNLTWQTRLVAEGLKVGTIHWKELKTPGYYWGSFPDNLGEALRTAGFKGRYVIIESIERLFQDRMKVVSKEHNPIVKIDIVVYTAPYAKRNRISLSNLNGTDWGKKALYTKIKLSLNSLEKYQSGIVQAINFDGCQFFSHRLCNYAIFIEDDLKKPTFNSIANVLTVNKNLQTVGIQAIWMILPDKATVYLGYGKMNEQPYQNIWQLFAQYPELIAPDLGAAFIRKSRTVKDFYMPNDTHLSTNGFLYLGDLMTQEMRKIKAK